jgi:coenzyme PQQ precursor peptide PqqA
MEAKHRKSCRRILAHSEGKNSVCAAVICRHLRFRVIRLYYFPRPKGGYRMAWTTPVLVEICIGLEINGYMPADGYVPPEF